MYTGHIHIIKRMNEENRRIFRQVRDTYKENIPKGNIYKDRGDRKEYSKEHTMSEEQVHATRMRIALDMQKEQNRTDLFHIVFVVTSIFLIALAIRLLVF